jgi:hypothetical protein
VILLAIRFIIVIVCIGIFKLGIRLGYLDSHNMSGSRFTADHAYGIIFLLFPMLPGWWIILTLFEWTAAIVLYMDDLYQHRRRTWDPYYESPLHKLGTTLGLYELRDWLSTKPGFGWLRNL